MPNANICPCSPLLAGIEIKLSWLLFAAIQALLNDIHALGCWSSTEVRQMTGIQLNARHTDGK